MKTTKKLVILCLVLVLGIAAIMPSAFSWYDHSSMLDGNRMRYKRDNLPLSSGTVSVVTKKYRTENNRLFYDEKGNKEYVGGGISTDTVAANTAQYYGTTFTNTGTAPAFVNLYLKDFTNKPENHIGTIAPSLTYKGISSSVHLANKNMIRIYFQYDQANNWNGATSYIVYKTKSGSRSYKTFSNHISEGTGAVLTRQQNILGNKITQTYYADLPENTTEFYFATSSGFNTTNYSVTMPWYRTKTITDVQAEKCYYLTGVADDTTFNAQYGVFDVPGGVSVMTYFDKATINKSQSSYVTLNEGTNYTGQSVAYAIQSGTNISVNANMGRVTANASFGTGSDIATIRTTITGSLGDTTYVDTKISNPTNIPAAAVSLNIEVPGKSTVEENGEQVTKNGTAEVVWYIDNKSSSNCSFASVYYTE